MQIANELFFLNVNWYEKWGYQLSDQAALLWILASVMAKRLNRENLSVLQLRRAAPLDWSDEDLMDRLEELRLSENSPVGFDGQTMTGLCCLERDCV